MNRIFPFFRFPTVVLLIVTACLGSQTMIEEVMGAGPADGFDIHIYAPHMMADGTPGGPFHHYCKGISDEVLQCLLFESTDPHAKLMGVEYVIGKSLARKEMALIDWNRNYHDHRDEIATGRVHVLDVTEEKAKAIAEALAKTDGIIFHLWPTKAKIPTGEVTIPTSVGHSFRTK